MKEKDSLRGWPAEGPIYGGKRKQKKPEKGGGGSKISPDLEGDAEQKRDPYFFLKKASCASSLKPDLGKKRGFFYWGN